MLWSSEGKNSASAAHDAEGSFWERLIFSAVVLLKNALKNARLCREGLASRQRVSSESLVRVLESLGEIASASLLVISLKHTSLRLALNT